MFNSVVVNIGGSVFKPSKFDFIAGLSVIHLFSDTSKIGVALNPVKLLCAECNTPIAEVVGASLVIRNKHHGQRHATYFEISELNKIANL